MNQTSNRLDYNIITDLVEDGAKVLDLGCGNGQLLEMLTQQKNAICQGIEIEASAISECMARGVSAIQGDLDQGLDDYPDQSFDYVVLNQTLQAVKYPDKVLEEMVRVGARGIVGFPNFGHWSTRLHLLVKGRMPITNELPYSWYDTPNIHLLTIKDLQDFCEQKSIAIKKKIFLTKNNVVNGKTLYNLKATAAVFVITKT